MNSDTYYSSNPSKSNSPRGLPISNYTIYQDELKLSNRGQLGLLMAFRERGIPLRTAVCGFSMQPFIRDRDVLTIEPMLNRQPRIGEVVAFIHPFSKKLAIHRVIARKNGEWLLKGDNVAEVDGLVSHEKLLGKAVRIERKDKELSPIFITGISVALIAFLSLHNGLIPIVKMIVNPLRVIRNLLKRTT